MVFYGEVIFLLTGSLNNLESFPIYHELSMLQFDIVSMNNSPYPVSVEQLLKFGYIIHVIVDFLSKLHINKQFCYYCSGEYHYGDCEI